jgi:hypothetical protein
VKVLAVVVAVALLGGVTAAAASPSRVLPKNARSSAAVQPHDVSGGYVRVDLHHTALDLAITRESAWDAPATKPKCLRPHAGRRALVFDVNWHAVSQKASLPDVHISVAAADKRLMVLGLPDGSCQAFSNFDFPASPPTTQWVFGGAIYLNRHGPLGALRISVNGVSTRLTLVRGCHPLMSPQPRCARHPTIKVP